MYVTDKMSALKLSKKKKKIEIHIIIKTYIYSTIFDTYYSSQVIHVHFFNINIWKRTHKCVCVCVYFEYI